MKNLIIFLLIVSVIGCKSRSLADINAEKESRLKAAMLSSLYKNVNNDSSKFKFEVKDVTFFESKDKFLCEFKVRLIHEKLDTTGIMTADISKDMSVVRRKS
jgi:hypothetical protein